MTTKLPIDPNNLPVNTGNLYPPVLLTGLTNDVEYTVTIVAHLLDGTTITESRKVTPYASPAPVPPVASTMNGMGLTGTGTPGNTIKLYDSNGVLVAEVIVDSNGNWSIPVSMFPGGTTVGFSGSFTVTDINGNESAPTMITSIDSIPPASPVTGSINGAGMAGTAEPGATVYLLDANGNIIASVLVDSTGHWFIPASSFPNGVISPFVGSIKVVDPAGNESAIVNLNISVDTSAPTQSIPTVQNATGLSGFAEPGSTINLLDSNGNIIASIVVDGSGQWSIPASSFPGGTTNGFSGSIVSVDAAGNISKPTVIHNMDGIAPAAPIITIINASRLSGTAEANTTIKLYNTSNTLISTTVVDALGNWSFTPDKFPGGITDGFTGSVSSTDLANNVSTATPVPTIDGLAPNPPVITIVNASGLFGTAEPLAVIRLYNSFGIMVTGTVANSSGNWSFLPTTFPGNVTDGYTGYLTQTDIVGNTSNQTTITAIDGILPNAPTYLIANYYGISGTAEAGSRISLKDGTGTEVAFVFTDMNGNWSIPSNSFPGQATDGFTGSITATDLAGNESVATAVAAINGVLPVAAVLTDYTDDVGTIQSTTSTAVTTDDTTPGINIGIAVIDTPILYIGGVLTASTYDSIAGTLTPNDALTDGTYDFTYTLTDSDGNISLPSPTLTITIDTTAPTTPSAPTTYDDNVGSVQNASSTAVTTDDTTPGINIGTSLTDIPKLYINNALVTSTYNSSTGTLTPNTALTEGNWNFSYTLTDATGNESSNSPPLTITIDLTAPATPTAPTTYVDNVGSVTSNTSVAPLTDDTTPGINIGSGLVDTPKLYVGGILTASIYDSVAGTLTPNSALPEGVNVITYTLTDAAGNESAQSPSITITVSTTPPTTTNITSYDDNVGSMQSATSVAVSTDDTTPGLNIGTGLTNIPKLYIGGILTAATYNSITGTLTPNVALTQGTYSFTYTLTDVVGNESLPSAVFSITIDTTAPTTPVSAPASYDDNIGSIQSTTSTAIITDDTQPGINVGTGLTDTVTLYVNDSAVVSTYDSVAGTLTPFYPLAEGTYKFSYSLTDAVGNESGQSPSISITIDTTPPTTPLNKPSSYIDNVGSIQSTTSNAAVTDDTTPGINIGAGLTNTPKLYVNGVYTAATYVSGTGIITPNSPLTDGLKSITYTLSDVAGNESGQSPAITLTIDTVAPTTTTPTTFLDNFGPFQYPASTLPITDDARPGIIIGTGLTDIVKLYVDGILTPASYDSSVGTLTPTLAVSDGTRTFAYTLTDTAGNESLLSAALTIVIDTIPPTTPVNAPASYVDNVGTIQSTTSIAPTTNDTTPGINIGVGITDEPLLYIDGVNVAATYNSIAGTLTPTVPLTEGAKSITYSLRDVAGNESGQSPAILMTIDIIPPPTPLTAPVSYVDNVGSIQSTTSNVAFTDDTTPGINIGAGLTNTPNLYVDNVMVASTYDNVAGTLTPNVGLTDGLHDITYSLSDPAGNESGQSPVLSITIDTMPPVTTAPTTYNDNVGIIQSTTNNSPYTDDTTPGINIGTGIVDTIRLYVNSILTAATYDSVTGTLTPNTPLSDGTYNFTYSLTDAAGNESSLSPALQITIDTVAPTISSVTPSWGAVLQYSEMLSNGTVTIATSGAENGSATSVTINNIVYTGTISSNSVATSIPYADFANLTNGGTYYINTTVTDIAGNSTSNNTVSFTVDSTPSGFISILARNVSTDNEMGWGMVMDSSKNKYVMGYGSNRSNIGDSVHLQIIKYNSAGTMQWHKDTGELDINYYSYLTLRGFAIDGSGNMYVVGQRYYYRSSTSTSYFNMIIIKVNSDGVFQWANQLGYTTSGISNPNDNKFYSVVLDSSANAYVVGISDVNESTTSYDIIIAKYSSSGSLTWKKTLNYGPNPPNADYGYSITIDSTNSYIYAVGHASSDYNYYSATLICYNTAGTLQWQRSISNAWFTAVTLDSSGNIYTGGFEDSSKTKMLCKYNSSGILQKQSYVNGLPTSWSREVLMKLVTAGTTLFFALGEYVGSIETTSWTLNWINKVTANSSLIYLANDIKFDTDGNINLSGTFTDGGRIDIGQNNPNSTVNLIGLLVLRVDGSQLGTYTVNQPPFTSVTIANVSGVSLSTNTNLISDGALSEITYTIPSAAVSMTTTDVTSSSSTNTTYISGSQTAITVPDSPTAVTASTLSQRAFVSFTPPTNNGGSGITNFTATSNPGNISVTGTESPIQITGLTNGTSYTFTVVATNSTGNSLPSTASSSVTPSSDSIGSGNDTIGYWLGTAGDGISKMYVAPKSVERPVAWGSYGSIRGTTSTTDGISNTNSLYARGSSITTGHPAAYYAKTLTLGGYNTWYLPAKDELATCWTNRLATPFTNSNYFSNVGYWSSTEATNNTAWYQYSTDAKSYPNYIRPVRRSTI